MTLLIIQDVSENWVLEDRLGPVTGLCVLNNRHAN